MWTFWGAPNPLSSQVEYYLVLELVFKLVFLVGVVPRLPRHGKAGVDVGVGDKHILPAPWFLCCPMLGLCFCLVNNFFWALVWLAVACGGWTVCSVLINSGALMPFS